MKYKINEDKMYELACDVYGSDNDYRDARNCFIAGMKKAIELHNEGKLADALMSDEEREMREAFLMGWSFRKE